MSNLNESNYYNRVNQVVKKAEDHKDKEGLLTKKVIIPNTKDIVYEVSNKSKYVKTGISICNNAGSEAEITIWVSTNKIPEEIDLIEPKIKLPANAVFGRYNVYLNPGEKLIIQSNKPSQILRLEGFDNRE